MSRYIPFRHISLDLLGSLEYQNSDDTSDIIRVNLLTIIDNCTRWVEISILANISKSLASTIFIPWGCNVRPWDAIPFCWFPKMMREFEILHKPSLVYNPTGNAICECIHRKVNAGLRIYQKENLKVVLGKFQDGLRNICHKSIGTTPNNLVFSRNKRNSAL